MRAAPHNAKTKVMKLRLISALILVCGAACGVTDAIAARDLFAPDVLRVESTYEGVWRDGRVVELIAKLTITNDGTTETDLEGKMLRLRFPGTVYIAGGGFDAETKAFPSDWDVSVCYWSFVRGRYNGTNVCPGIERRVTADALEVRFLTSLKLCPGCVLRGDSEGRSFVVKHDKYHPIIDAGALLQPLGPVVPISTVVDAPLPRKRTCFPADIDFSFKVKSYPSRVDAMTPTRQAVQLGSPGYDAFLRIQIDVENRGSVGYDMSDVVINLPFDFKIFPNVGEDGIAQDPEQFFTRCHGQVCDYSTLSISPARDAFQIRFRDGFALCPGCRLRGLGLGDDIAYEIYSPFLFPLNIESVRGATAYCE